MRRAGIIALLALLSGCGGYSGPTTGDIPLIDMVHLSRDEMARLYPKANACIADGDTFWPADPYQHLMTGPGFEACPGIIAELKAQYQHEAATQEAERKAAVAKAEADDVARRRAILAAP